MKTAFTSTSINFMIDHESESGGLRDRFDSNSPPMEYPSMAIKSVVTNYVTGT